MKVLAINSSPNMGRGITALILEPFLDGMKEGGAEVELFYTREIDIEPCRGELVCWLKTPGRCFLQDDMQTLYPRLREADIWVFATPVYVDGVSGPMKNLLDRTISLMRPFYELRDGHCRHPMREEVNGGQVVLVSSCGFWEMDNFEPLVMHLKAACKNWEREFAGALLRPHGPQLRRLLKKGKSVEDVFEAAREAGHQLVRDGEISSETLGLVGRKLVSRGEHVDSLNRGFRRALDALKGR